ncbi:pyridoxal-phosphate dependent enzyme [Nakamurella deserti]|uniref:pyridoxal-phosphate dependent enzyme n=1 Tax=Nakamurella deserti TaxID=2164074 RepID=UPI000DBE8FF2|nr:pyridoxal-phosphate dependent enzyme [Nakamurella deserti]
MSQRQAAPRAGTGDGPRLRLGSWPTPLEAAPRLAAALGLGADDLWIKRDDLIGLGGGGNKVRKLEYTLGGAVADGARTVVTSGAPQSNHARLTAAAAARQGLTAVLVLEGDAPTDVRGNLLLDGLLGAELVWAGHVGPAALAARVEQEATVRTAAGRPAAVIPFGGSSVLGAHGYVRAGEELLDQAPELTTVVTAVGSGATMAGLVHALGAGRVLGVDTGAVSDGPDRVAGLVAGLSGTPADPEALRWDGDQVGAGYGTLTAAVRSALRLLARTEGVVLDPVYTGRAAAGLVDAVRTGAVSPGERTVLLHSGGLPGLFGHPDAATLTG